MVNQAMSFTDGEGWVLTPGTEMWGPQPGEPRTPIWTVQSGDGEDERIEGGLLTTDGGALVALSEEGLLVRAWAPGQWRMVRRLEREKAGVPSVAPFLYLD
jgi:hypothetical protein